MSNRPNEATIGPRFVYREVVRAEGALVNAQKATEDRLVADAIERARKELRPALARAQTVLKHADLVSAPQPDLLTDNESTQEE